MQRAAGTYTGTGATAKRFNLFEFNTLIQNTSKVTIVVMFTAHVLSFWAASTTRPHVQPDTHSHNFTSTTSPPNSTFNQPFTFFEPHSQTITLSLTQ